MTQIASFCLLCTLGLSSGQTFAPVQVSDKAAAVAIASSDSLGAAALAASSGLAQLSQVRRWPGTLHKPTHPASALALYTCRNLLLFPHHNECRDACMEGCSTL